MQSVYTLQSSTGNIEQTQNRPRFVTTVPSGILLPPPSKEEPVKPQRTYAYFSIPKLFAQRISQDNADYPIKEIQPIEMISSYTKAFKLR